LTFPQLFFPRPRITAAFLLRQFLSHFTHLMALLLWVGGLIGFLAQLPQLGVAIWLVNVINVSLR